MSIKSKIESVLFVSTKPLSVKQITNLLKCSPQEVQQSVDSLIIEYNQEGRGINLVSNQDKYQFTTSPENADLMQEMMRREITGELTRPSLETLTVIAYRGPITKAELEQLRGVNCSMILRNLLMRGLIEAQYDKQRAVTLYNVTINFMRYLGINDVNELPDYEKLNSDERLVQLLKKEDQQE